jgi:hypothetical protein
MKWMVSVVALLAASSGVATAGQKISSPVQVNLSGRSAAGSVGTARNSLDTTQYIGCQMWSFGDSTGATIYCFARTAPTATAASTYAQCIAGNSPSMASVVDAMGPASQIVFEWDANGNCTYIAADNSSSWEPKR